MRKVVIARIDDRLIHGQVVTAWVKNIKSDGILIIDNELAGNELMKRVYRAAAPSNVNLFIRTLEDAVPFMKDTSEHPEFQDVFLLVKTPNIIEHLVESGIEIDEIILGGMGANCDRKQLIRNVYTSDEERSSMKRMNSDGIDILYQLVPDDKALSVKDLL